MCLLVKNDGKQHVIIAADDITVYKVISKKGHLSWIYGFRYAPNTLYKLGKPLQAVNEGADPAEDDMLEYTHGFHSYKDIKTAQDNTSPNNRKIVRFYIPKGTAYIEGKNNEIVSENIRSGDLKCV